MSTYPTWTRPGAVRPDNQLVDFPFTFCPAEPVRTAQPTNH